MMDPKTLKKYGGYLKYKFNRFLPLLIFFISYLLLFAVIEQVEAPEYHYTYMRLDRLIPFCEFFVIPYFAWFLMVPGVCIYLLFHKESEYKRMSYMLVFGMSVFIVFSLIVPTKLYLRPYFVPGDNMCSRLVSYLYSIDTSTNVFPSIHVYNTCVAMQAVMRSNTKLFKKPGMRIGIDVLSVLIILSTVFIKQHSLLDVVGALLLFVLADRLVSIYVGDTFTEPVFSKEQAKERA
ncbi:MAG: serine/threonine protein phosphatase [Lachnospiraceae bacterium]|nr:serine/threonine protein phosphatase [Lachnospiraceae bacterium]